MMGQVIARATDLLTSERSYVWFVRSARWLFVVLILIFTVVAPLNVLAGIVLVGVVLFGEFRDWNARKRSYSLATQFWLAASTMTSASVIGEVLLCFVEPLKYQHGGRLFIIELTSIVGLIEILAFEAAFQYCVTTHTTTVLSAQPPPFLAEYILYLFLPRRERETLLGDLNEDFITNVVPRFGPLCAAGWFWHKTILYVWMYTCDSAIEPLIRRVVEPLWRQVVLPLLKWVIAPALVVHKQGLVDAVRGFIDRLR